MVQEKYTQDEHRSQSDAQSEAAEQYENQNAAGQETPVEPEIVNEATPSEATTPETAASETEIEADAVEAAQEEAAAEFTEAELIEQLREELSATQARADEYLDKLQRTAADYQNSRRRLEQQLNDEVARANSALIKQLLPILDDLDLAFQNVPEAWREATGQENGSSETAWLHGFRQIRKKLLDTLSEQGVTPIETEGEFDPMRHEAISSEPSDEVESGHVIAPVRAGYEYKGRVLRPALVRVAM